MLYGALFHRYMSPVEFIQDFASTHIMVGGIFSATSDIAELLVTRNPVTGGLYVFENFSHPRRICCQLPINVFETDETILGNTLFKQTLNKH